MYTEALNQRMIRKMSRKEFDDLIKSFEDSLLKPKSFADATKEEMFDLITKIEDLGNRMDWKELKLKNEETLALEKYYQLIELNK